jgi:DNA uptake protein ComE-like DNA-binding protein
VPPEQTPAAAPPQSAPAALPARTPASTTAVDINRVTAIDLASDLNIDWALADHVVAVRDARGRYQSIDHLAEAAGLQPHQLVRFRNKVTFGTAHEQQNPPTGAGGRILDY